MKTMKRYIKFAQSHQSVDTDVILQQGKAYSKVFKGVCSKYVQRCSGGMFKICSKLTIKILERRQLCRSNIFVDDFEQIIKTIKIVIPTKVFFCGL